jgi:cyclohexyl-isocyanide hydratase
MKKYKTGMLLFPNLTLQDFVGPHDVFVRAGCFEVLVISDNAMPVKAEGGLTIQANYSLEDCPPLDIIFVPGGAGINSLLINVQKLNTQ